MSTVVYGIGAAVPDSITLPVPPDGSTVVTIEVIRPDGSSVVPDPAIVGPTGNSYATTFTAAVAGDWVVVWTVTGTGGPLQTAHVFNVRAVAGWAPFLSDVGQYVPLKTQDTLAGSDIRFGTFNARTEPDHTAVQGIIDGAIAGILGVVPVILPALEDLATTAAALRAAADVELAWPQRAADMTQYNALDERAKTELARLVAADTTSPTGSTAGVPQWNMPDPPAWADDVQMWL